MKAKPSRLLVVDTSVARAAGETDHPTSSACRQLLLDILVICHRVAACDEMRAEWRRNASRFTRKWMRSMAARKKPLRSIATDAVPLQLERFEDAHREAIEKDLFLLEIAIAADGIVVTLDTSLRRALDTTEEGRRLSKRLVWIDPVEKSVDTVV